MKFLLDSDMVNILYDDKRAPYHEELHCKISNLKEEDNLVVSVLVLYELEYSFHNAPPDKKDFIKNTIHSVLNDFDAVLSLNIETAPVFGEIKAMLKKEKALNRKQMRKHNIDIMLAGTAISNSSVLISADRIYYDIMKLKPGFYYENWIGN